MHAGSLFFPNIETRALFPFFPCCKLSLSRLPHCIIGNKESNTNSFYFTWCTLQICTQIPFVIIASPHQPPLTLSPPIAGALMKSVEHRQWATLGGGGW